MAADSVALLAPPDAHSSRAADGTASSGVMMSGAAGGPNPSVPQRAQAGGRNCRGPSAPALDGPSLAPSPLSISPIAASTVQDRPGQYFAADSLNRSIQLAGTPVGAFGSTGSVPAAFSEYATRLTT